MYGKFAVFQEKQPNSFQGKQNSQALPKQNIVHVSKNKSRENTIIKIPLESYSYKNLTSNFTNENNTSYVNWFNSICELKISSVKLTFICESAISYVKHTFQTPTCHKWNFCEGITETIETFHVIHRTGVLDPTSKRRELSRKTRW